MCCILFFTSCQKFIEVAPPITSTNAGNVYNGNTTAAAVLTGIYSTLSADENANIGIGGMNIATSLSADELTLLDGITTSDLVTYYRNVLNSNPSQSSLSVFWSSFYTRLFVVNSAIEGLNDAERLSPQVKAQLLGEAHFMRAYIYFQLVNLYGDVPLILSTDYKITGKLGRENTEKIYQQIKDDLLKAQSLLSANYLDGTLLKSTALRVRPNKAVATALLSRVYLYTKDWQNAETQASQIITNTAIYKMETLAKVFVKESMESIWSIQPTGNDVNANTGAGKLFVLPASGPSGQFYLYLNDELVNSFEPDDQRATNWINNVTAFGVTYSYAYKYKVGAVQSPTLEYPVIFRLAEMYLIRAEARAQQNKLIGSNSAQSDLDVIRNRAGLEGTTSTTQTDLLASILIERRHELFTEFGHRWFDLKRTKTIDMVMESATEKKGGTWSSDAALYPVPLAELRINLNLVQNRGY
nr:RagB/SusD family nutrient uptake outer membrane protein [uncultured Pedobacter sp.]